MSYSDFTKIDQAVTALELTVEDIPHLFSQIPLIEPSQRLKETLEESLDLAASISTEKARSELIITPILLEIRRLFKNKIGYFSGNTFNIDASKGLTGACDFILSASNNQSLITAPVLTLVEAKDNDISIGLGQCVAQMVGAQIFNARKGAEQKIIYGAVSTGTNWKFLTLEGNLVKIDLTEYFINQIDKILGILAEPFKLYYGS
ncbi:hypothetical protein NIES4071_85060 [Calothrix sp. NIES-4071]|nr:hypothetical protein NIES4071_85060 [Calothrix sp. NIES-4071]BAZ62773.1 hypothetical protein NIES4105_84990 [Calothrix sp. NIES-4105]